MILCIIYTVYESNFMKKISRPFVETFLPFVLVWTPVIHFATFPPLLSPRLRGSGGLTLSSLSYKDFHHLHSILLFLFPFFVFDQSLNKGGWLWCHPSATTKSRNRNRNNFLVEKSFSFFQADIVKTFFYFSSQMTWKSGEHGRCNYCLFKACPNKGSPTEIKSLFIWGQKCTTSQFIWNVGFMWDIFHSMNLCGIHVG